MSRSRLPLPALIAVVFIAVLAIVAGFVARAPLERSLVLGSMRSLTKFEIDAAAAERTRDGYVLHDVVIRTPGGGLEIRTPRLSARRERDALARDSLAVVVQSPQVRIDVRRGASHRMPHAQTRLVVRTAGAGTLAVLSERGTLRFDALEGDVRLGEGAPSYEGTLALVVRAQRYPIAVHGRTTPDGAPSAHWTAATLPIVPLAAFGLDDPPLVPSGGSLSAVDVELGATIRASAHLGSFSGTLGHHALRGVHGDLALAGDGIGSRALVGMLDAIPFSASGEVHGLPRDASWLYDGSPDLRALAKLLGEISREPRVRSVRLEAIAPGLAYAQYGLAQPRGPVAISVLAIEAGEPTLRFDTAIAEDHVFSGGERTSALGLRTGAVAGVNGDYFDIGRTYQPQGLLLRGGELVRGPTDRAAALIDKHNRVTFGEFSLSGSVVTARGKMPITELNDWPPGDVCVITPAFGKQLPASPGRTFVALRPLGDGLHFRVTAVESLAGPLPVRFGIAIGPLVRVPLPHVGERIALHYALSPNVPGAIAGIGGGPILVRGGQWYEDPHAPAKDERDYRWPVIALATQAGGSLLLVAVDGRHPERSIGMTRPEFGAVLARLGAIDAMALDSGGSVTMVARSPGDPGVSLHNVPSDNSAERWISDALLLYSDAPAGRIVAPAGSPAPSVLPRAAPTP